MQLSTKHLLGIRDLEASDIQTILDTATQFKEVLQRPIKKVPTLRDVTIVNLFYENSTRTRISFELAEKRLSADTINFTASGSSVSKGESLLDTVNNILSMKVDMHLISWLNIFLQPLSTLATASTNIPRRPCWMPFPLGKNWADSKGKKLRSSVISCTPALHSAIFIC